MKKLTQLLFIFSIATLLFSFTIDSVPSDWFKAGSQPSSYEMGIDNLIFKSGKSSATIQSAKKKIKGFGTLMQTCLADDYLGKRIKLSGFVKSEDLSDWAGFWLRIDNNQGKSIGFDNMQDRAIKGTTDWVKYEIVLDVPESAATLNFGALLSGTGKIWFDDLTIEIIEGNTLNTGTSTLKKPSNLSFEK
jgi:hypothetical protein|tara:strand:+ start:6603 stop:7172 length:570 start_codon:yes stop_codon:yes gene_type:complete